MSWAPACDTFSALCPRPCGPRAGPSPGLATRTGKDSNRAGLTSSRLGQDPATAVALLPAIAKPYPRAGAFLARPRLGECTEGGRLRSLLCVRLVNAQHVLALMPAVHAEPVCDGCRHACAETSTRSQVHTVWPSIPAATRPARQCPVSGHAPVGGHTCAPTYTCGRAPPAQARPRACFHWQPWQACCHPDSGLTVLSGF